jgi:hypothetical protein
MNIIKSQEVKIRDVRKFEVGTFDELTNQSCAGERFQAMKKKFKSMAQT